MPDIMEQRADGSGCAHKQAGCQNSEMSNLSIKAWRKLRWMPYRTRIPDFRLAAESKKTPKTAVDGVAGMILAFAGVSGTPDQAFW